MGLKANPEALAALRAKKSKIQPPSGSLPTRTSSTPQAAAPPPSSLPAQAGIEEASEVKPPEIDPPELEVTPPESLGLLESEPTAEFEGEDREAVATPVEIIKHAALDSIFFCRHFFPKTFRQASPPFHRDIWGLLDDPTARYINVQVQRDGAKTTILRTYIAKRVSYGLSRTILYLGASEDKAMDSIHWVKRQVETNRNWSEAFKLKKGKLWSAQRIEIEHEIEGYTITILALGISGSVRGINIDDYRPDLIVIDDVIKDDNAATDLQRHKISELILGAVKESLSPASETPDAKMVIINTPQDFEDLSQRALRDPQFRSARFGCWTLETEELPIELQESAWPERYPSEVLRDEKRAAIARNMLSVFAREKECRLITTETSAFRAEWLRYFGEGESEPEPPRHEMWVELVIDPVPPPSDVQIAKGLLTKDFEAFSVVGRWRNKYYVLETVYNRGHQPNWTVATFFELCNRWNPRKVIVEAIAYQATLAWLLREGMKRTGRFVPIQEFKDKRKKIDRIRDGLAGPLSEGALYVRKSQTALISQIVHYPGKNPGGTFDDIIETVANGVASLSKGMVGDVPIDHYKYVEHEMEALEGWRGAP